MIYVSIIECRIRVDTSQNFEKLYIWNNIFIEILGIKEYAFIIIIKNNSSYIEFISIHRINTNKQMCKKDCWKNIGSTKYLQRTCVNLFRSSKKKKEKRKSLRTTKLINHPWQTD